MDKANKILRLRVLILFWQIQQLELAQAEAMAKMYQELIDSFIKRINSMGGTVHKARLLPTIKLLEAAQEALADKLAGSLDSVSKSIANKVARQMEAIYTFDKKLAGVFVPLEMDAAKVVAIALADINEFYPRAYKRKDGVTVTLKDWFTEMWGSDTELVVTQAKAATLAGHNPTRVARELSKYLKEIAPATMRYIKTLTRTMMIGSAHAARREFYRANQQHIDEYEWHATLEVGSGGRGTCIRCGALDGTKYDKESDAPDLPLHPNCRCLLLPTVKWPKEVQAFVRQEAERWERAHDTGKGNIIPNQPFSDWLLDQPISKIEDVVGPHRAELIRDGKIKFRDLIKKDGTLKTLDELPAQ